MHPRPRIRSSQHIELVFNHQFYDVADREPLPLGPLASLGPIRTAQSRRHSPYTPAHSRPSSASPASSRQTSPSSVEQGRTMSPVALRGRASISELDYAEDSDGSDDGLYQGRAVSRQPRVSLRMENSLDSSSDDWLDHADNSPDDDRHAAPAAALSAYEEHEPSTRTARRSSRAPSTGRTHLGSAVRSHPSSGARDHASTAPRSHLTSRGRDRVSFSAREQASNARQPAHSRARDGPSRPRSRSLSVVPDGSTKIPKPPGEPGRPNSGGYNLEEKLGWPRKKYREVLRNMNRLVEMHLQCDRSVTRQLPARYAVYEAEALAQYPEMEERFEGGWPVRAFAISHLHYIQNNSRRITHSQRSAST
ncbi:uncharacterized protein SCHCODRAFT_02496431 [Schizophyllum commune H4-8]|nr:uncharacterized protein SCHCODRAFT_02496431 [Schizophyllum commune H4-8]KAI5895821.1 hypothetical protein SCHCODRAFT_02496431 [Schizophyllum commune H4-8]